MKKFNHNSIRILRQAHGLSQSQFAEKIGNTIKKQHVSQWENDEQKPSVDSLARIANAFNVPIDIFFDKVD